MGYRVAFLWQGVTIHYGKRFEDGLYQALKYIEEEHTVKYFEPDAAERIHAFNPDVILYWGALCEQKRPLVIEYPYPKAICFAGGQIEDSNVHGFDLYFTESAINEEEFEKFGKPWKRAFGINDLVFKPMAMEKHYDGIFWGAFAGWKRHNLFAEALGSSGIAIGQHQEHEAWCYEVCKEHGVEVLPESPRDVLVPFINRSYTAVNTSDFWGGGQRMTLEAMACDIPPIVMSDSPKNREYVEESGFGLVVDPNPEAIRSAIAQLKADPQTGGREYIKSKYSARHYADSLLEGIQMIV